MLTGANSTGSLRPSFGGWDSSQFVALRNRQSQTQMMGLLAGLPSYGGKVGSPLSVSLLNQVYDAKAMTPSVIKSYLARVDEVMGEDSALGPSAPVRNQGNSLVDEILSQGAGSQEPAPDSNSTVASSPSEEPTQVSPYEYYGIVGEIFDKYS